MKAMAIFAVLVVAGIGALVLAYGQNSADRNAADKSTSGADATSATTAQAAASDPLQPGAPAPLFALPDQDNKVHQLKDMQGKIVVLAFYPADMTKGCSLEAHNLTASLDEFKKRDVELFGISVQDVNSKKQFCETEGIKYTLLADVEKSASKDYGVLSDKGVAKRVTFVIDKEGKIAAVDPAVNPASVVPDTLKMVDAVIEKSVG